MRRVRRTTAGSKLLARHRAACTSAGFPDRTGRSEPASCSYQVQARHRGPVNVTVYLTEGVWKPLVSPHHTSLTSPLAAPDGRLPVARRTAHLVGSLRGFHRQAIL